MSYEVNFDKANRNIEAVWDTGETMVDEMGVTLRKVKVLSVSHFGSSKAISAVYRDEMRGKRNGFSIRRIDDIMNYERIMTVACARYSEKALRQVFTDAVWAVETGNIIKEAAQ